MSLTHIESQITWSAAASIDVAAAASQVSDAKPLDPTCIGATLSLRADNQGTPASGDRVEIRLAYTSGDILGDSGDDFDTAEHAELVAVLNTFASDTPGEDPCQVTVPLGALPVKALKVIATNKAASNAIRVWARLLEQRST